MSDQGELSLTWEPFDAARAHLVVALRDPESFDASAFWRGAVDNDLIRVPVDPRAGRGAAWVPAGRPVAVALVARSDDGRPLPHRALTVEPASAPPPDRHGTEADRPVWRARDGALHTHPPGAHAPRDRAVDFVFADGDSPDLGALARRVAATLIGGPPGTDTPPRTTGPSAGFGTRQRWYLTRLTFPLGEGPRLLVRRPTFIDDATLTAWTLAPPDDALPVPEACDGLVDALAEADATTFYALLTSSPAPDAARPAAWRPLPLSPTLPPFDRCAHPLVLGDAGARLAPALDARLADLRDGPLALADLSPVLALIEAAVAFLPADDPLRQQTAGAVTALATEPRF